MNAKSGSAPFADAHTHRPEFREGVARVFCLPYEAWKSASGVQPPFCAGIHPQEIASVHELQTRLKELEAVLKLDGAAALGECGLDRRFETPLEAQLEFFLAQARLAFRLKLPLVAHCVRAFPELVSARKNFVSAPPWIVHGFRGNASSATELVRHGFLISFGAALLRPPQALIEAFSAVPDASLLFETDEATASIESVFEAAAKLRGSSLTELKELAFANFQRAFSL